MSGAEIKSAKGTWAASIFRLAWTMVMLGTSLGQLHGKSTSTTLIATDQVLVLEKSDFVLECNSKNFPTFSNLGLTWTVSFAYQTQIIVKISGPLNDNSRKAWHPDYAGRSTVSEHNGRLTVTNATVLDSGRYTCTVQYPVEMTRIWDAIIYVQPRIESDNELPIEDIVFQHRCVVDRVSKEASVLFRWSINHQAPHYGTDEAKKNNTDGTIQIANHLDSVFNRSHNGYDLQCLEDISHNDRNFQFFAGQRLDVRYTYNTFVNASAVALQRGTPLRLQCVNASDGNPDRIKQYRWKLNGTIITNANRSVLNITSASDEDTGHYTCHIRNAAGWTRNAKATAVIIQAFHQKSKDTKTDMLPGIITSAIVGLLLLVLTPVLCLMWKRRKRSGKDASAENAATEMADVARITARSTGPQGRSTHGRSDTYAVQIDGETSAFNANINSSSAIINMPIAEYAQVHRSKVTMPKTSPVTYAELGLADVAHGGQIHGHPSATHYADISLGQPKVSSLTYAELGLPSGDVDGSIRGNPSQTLYAAISPVETYKPEPIYCNTQRLAGSNNNNKI